jgi:hypothetical protein
MKRPDGAAVAESFQTGPSFGASGFLRGIADTSLCSSVRSIFALAYSFGLTARHRPGAGKEYGTRPMPPVALAGCWLLALLYRRIANDFEHFCGENALSQEIKG